MKCGPLSITTAGRCAWRAFYCRAGTWQFFHAGLTPMTARIECFGGIAVPIPGPRRFVGFSWRFPVLWARWRQSGGPIARAWYSIAARTSHRLDGRFA